MSEQAKQHSRLNEEENDSLQDDTVKTPAIRQLSTLTAALPPPPISHQQEQATPSVATVEARAQQEQVPILDDDDDMDEVGIQATMKMPALKRLVQVQGEESGSFSEEYVDTVDMTPEQEQPTLPELIEEARDFSKEEPLYNERAVIIATIAEILAATTYYVLAELATIVSYKAQSTRAEQQAEEAATPLPQKTGVQIQPASSPFPLKTRDQHAAQAIYTAASSEETLDTSETASSMVVLQGQTPMILDTPQPQEATIETPEPEEGQEQVTAASPVAPVTILDTPRPQEAESSDRQEQERVAFPSTPHIRDQDIPVTPILGAPTSQRLTRPSVVQRPQRLSFWRRMLAAIFSVLLIISVVLLWRDLTATHLLLTQLDPGNGNPRFQQDIASYQDKPSLLTSSDSSSTIAVGLHNDTSPDGTHRVFVFHTQNGQWSQQTQFAAPLSHATVQLSTTGQVLINSTQAMQVRTTNGSLLWTAASDQPMLGVHRFQAISNQQTLYTIKSLSQSQIVAYDLRSGQTNWVQTLDDSLNYTPPFLLSESMLYIASDHNIYALNNSDGTLRWQQPYPSRTLLLTQQGQTPLLIAAGTQGLLALDPTTGQLIWTFKGQASDTLTPPEFYQAITDITSANITAPSRIYTTGITWRIPEIQEQVWLYAVDAHTGTQVWARRVGDSFIAADAGRIFSPRLDTIHHLVLLQQQSSANSQQIAAFNASTGSLQWTTTLGNTAPAAATLLETADGTPLLFRTLSNSSDLLWIFSPLRVLLLIVMLVSVTVLGILWLPSWYATLARCITQMLHPQASKQGNPQGRTVNSHLQVRLWMIVPLLLICISASAFGYIGLRQTQKNIAQITTRTGSKAWQYTSAQHAYPLLTNTHSSIIVSTNTQDHLTQLQSLSADGKVKWQTFASEGTFATPTAMQNASQAGTLLVTLSGHGLRPYQFAPDDTAYQHPIEHVLVLYLFNQANGNILWQQVAIPPAAQQQGVVLGADTHDLYIASTPLSTAQKGSGQATQLLAINQATGVVDWHIFGPMLATPPTVPDIGTLLLSRGLAIWQVNGIVYAIDTAMGQIAWRHPLQSDVAALLPTEEQQMFETPTAPNTPTLLLVNRLDGIHALDLASGNELWHLAGLGVALSPTKAGFAVAGHVLLVYGNGQLQAFDTQSHLNLWSQKQLSSIEQFRVSDDGTLLYLLLLNTVQGNTLAPSVIALDTQTGATRWTFTLLGQTPVQPGTSDTSDNSDSFFYSHDLLFVVTCVNSEMIACHHQYLYALSGITGKIVWKLTDTTIAHIHLSQDGTTLIARTTSSAWEDFIAYLQN